MRLIRFPVAVLLQWVKLNQRRNSIKYFSVKTNLNQDIDFSSFNNLVVPIQEVKNSGYCSILQKCFLYSDPICFENIDLESDVPREAIKKYITDFRPDPTYLLNSLKEVGTDYIRSIFGRGEIKLCDMPLT